MSRKPKPERLSRFELALYIRASLSDPLQLSAAKRAQIAGWKARLDFWEKEDERLRDPVTPLLASMNKRWPAFHFFVRGLGAPAAHVPLCVSHRQEGRHELIPPAPRRIGDPWPADVKVEQRWHEGRTLALDFTLALSVLIESEEEAIELLEPVVASFERTVEQASIREHDAPGVAALSQSLLA